MKLENSHVRQIQTASANAAAFAMRVKTNAPRETNSTETGLIFKHVINRVASN